MTTGHDKQTRKDEEDPEGHEVLVPEVDGGEAEEGQEAVEGEIQGPVHANSYLAFLSVQRMRV